MTGKQLQDAIVDLAHTLGYRAAHFAPTQRADQHGARHFTAYAYDGKGFPDLVLAGRGRVVFIEVKGDGDRLRDDQHEWISALAAGDAIVAVATPTLWRQGLIEKLLKDGPLR